MSWILRPCLNHSFRLLNSVFQLTYWSSKGNLLETDHYWLRHVLPLYPTHGMRHGRDRVKSTGRRCPLTLCLTGWWAIPWNKLSCKMIMLGQDLHIPRIFGISMASFQHVSWKYYSSDSLIFSNICMKFHRMQPSTTRLFYINWVLSKNVYALPMTSTRYERHREFTLVQKVELTDVSLDVAQVRFCCKLIVLLSIFVLLMFSRLFKEQSNPPYYRPFVREIRRWPVSAILSHGKYIHVVISS